MQATTWVHRVMSRKNKMVLEDKDIVEIHGESINFNLFPECFTNEDAFIRFAHSCLSHQHYYVNSNFANICIFGIDSNFTYF